MTTGTTFSPSGPKAQAADPFEGMNLPDQLKEYLLKPSVTLKDGKTISAKEFIDGLLNDGYGNPEYFSAPKGSQAGFLTKPGSPKVTLNDKQMFYADAAFMAKKRAQKKQEQAKPAQAAQAAVPHFETYDDANDWIERRAKDLGMSRLAFSSTDEYKAVYPQIVALYQDQKAKTAERRMASLRDAGLAAGDRVRTTVIGMFLDVTDYSGTIVLRGGEPWVKVDGGITVSKNGRLREASMVRWDSRWKKQTA